jgi:phosphate/sulfate permease
LREIIAPKRLHEIPPWHRACQAPISAEAGPTVCPIERVDGLFRRVQFVSASLYSLGHGGNDAQKTIGIIAALLSAHGQLTGAFHVPLWVVIGCNGAMALGTLLGGRRIVRTMVSRITRLTPVQGVRKRAVRWIVAQ